MLNDDVINIDPPAPPPPPAIPQPPPFEPFGLEFVPLPPF